MHHRRAHAPSKSLFKIAIAAVAAAVLLSLLPAGAGARESRIEGFPNYHPQTTCSPKPKRGTVMLANYLMRRYKGTGSLGISRSCRAGGVSEHKEGRAFDWALSAGSRRDRHYAADFLRRLRKPDRFGRRDALARRMGIMYAIWNDRIYSATHHYRTRRYKHPACRTIRRCSASYRHRNHMHISLTRSAARKKTSWYEGRGGPSSHKVKHKVKRKRDHRKKHAAHRGNKTRQHAHHKARPHKAHKARHPKAWHHKPRHKVRHHRVHHLRHHHKAQPHKARSHAHRRHHKAHPRKARHHAHRRHHRR